MQTFREFMQAREKAASSFARGCPDEVLALTTTNQPASFFGPFGQTKEGPAAVRKYYEDVRDQFGNGGQGRLKILHLAESGDLAYWCGYQDGKIELEGKLVPTHLRVTELFRRENGDWKLVHRHADRPQ